MTQAPLLKVTAMWTRAVVQATMQMQRAQIVDQWLMEGNAGGEEIDPREKLLPVLELRKCFLRI